MVLRKSEKGKPNDKGLCLGFSVIYGRKHIVNRSGDLNYLRKTFRLSGSRGCLITLASELGLIHNKGLTLEEFVLELKRNNQEVMTLLNLIIHAFGVALSNVVIFTNPDQIF